MGQVDVNDKVTNNIGAFRFYFGLAIVINQPSRIYVWSSETQFLHYKNINAFSCINK